MQKKELESLSYKEDLELFYDKYLNLGNGFDNGYLNTLLERYLILWQEKIKNWHESEGKRLNLKAMQNFKYTLSDYESFSSQDREFLNFYHSSLIDVNEDYDVIIDAYGSILNFVFKRDLSMEEMMELKRYLHTNIFAFLRLLPDSVKHDEAYQKAEDILLQNIFVSKLNNALFEEINKRSGRVEAYLFAIANARLINYDEEMKNKIDYEAIFTKKIPTRSLR